jgi:hypothetical protein
MLLGALAAIGLPALVLQISCVGNSCEELDAGAARVPFCSLPADLRARIVAGFRDGRSPDVLAVAKPGGVVGATGQSDRVWPAVGERRSRVPIAFMGAGVDAEAELPSGTRLDAIVPTIAEIIDLDRPHPEVRSGRPIEGIAEGERPRLVVIVVLTETSSDEISSNPGAVPFLAGLTGKGPATMEGDPGSLPMDPAATLTTIGAGGMPRQHGITGRYVRADDGAVHEAWGKGAPLSVIATLGDDLDELLDERPKIGLVGTDRSELGTIGGNWYIGVDEDDVLLRPGRGRAGAVSRVLARGYGRDEVTDLLAVTVPGPVVRADRALRGIVGAAEHAAPGGATIVVTAVGTTGEDPGAEPHDRIVSEVNERLGTDVIEATALGGFFVDQRVAAREQITEDTILQALNDIEAPFADVFPAISVSFARYC